ncbi:MAG: AMP-binding protein, partial [Catenulispora sp.]
MTARWDLGDGRGLHSLLIRSAARTPDAPAVTGPGGPMTYGELDRRADELAAALAGLGVGPGDRVLIWAPKSAATLAAMQAVLRLAAVYVPVDPLTPADRAALIARECRARALCAPAELRER